MGLKSYPTPVKTGSTIIPGDGLFCFSFDSTIERGREKENILCITRVLVLDKVTKKYFLEGHEMNIIPLWVVFSRLNFGFNYGEVIKHFDVIQISTQLTKHTDHCREIS